MIKSVFLITCLLNLVAWEKLAASESTISEERLCRYSLLNTESNRELETFVSFACHHAQEQCQEMAKLYAPDVLSCVPADRPFQTCEYVLAHLGPQRILSYLERPRRYKPPTMTDEQACQINGQRCQTMSTLYTMAQCFLVVDTSP